MRISGVARSAAMLAAGVSAGCVSPSPQGGMPPVGVLPGAATVRPTSHVVSWMGKGVKQQDLLYVSNGDGVVNVYRYWQRTLVGVLTNFKNPLGECADAAGDVYIADQRVSKVYEYAHGGTKRVKTLADPTFWPEGCSVDLSSGAVAVASYGSNRTSGDIAVYSHGSGKPVLYGGGSGDHFTACAYDRRGDMLATASYGGSGFYYADFYYLPKHGVRLLPMTLPGPYQSWQWNAVQSVTWDGKYWVVGSYDTLYRYTIDVKATYVSSTQLYGTNATVYQVAIYHPLVRSHTAEIVGAAHSNSSSAVDYWNYPAGGNPIGQLTKGLDRPYGVAISLGAQ